MNELSSFLSLSLCSYTNMHAYTGSWVVERGEYENACENQPPLRNVTHVWWTVFRAHSRVPLTSLSPSGRIEGSLVV